MAGTSGYRNYYPEQDLDEAWKIGLRSQFHNILDVSSIGPVYDKVQKFYDKAFERGERALDFSLETIAGAIDTRGEGVILRFCETLGRATEVRVLLPWPVAVENVDLLERPVRGKKGPGRRKTGKLGSGGRNGRE